MENTKDDNSPISFRQSIEGFGNVYESIFQTAMKLCIQMNLQDESKIAAKKIISYNPSNQELAETFPEYEKIAQFISQLILSKIQPSTQHSINNDIPKNQNKNLDSLLNEEQSTKIDQFHSFQNLKGTKLNEQTKNESQEFSSKAIPWNILGNCYLLLGDFPNAFASLSQFFQYNYNGSFDCQRKKLNHQSQDDRLDTKFFFWFSFGIINAHYKYHHNAIKCFQNFLDFVEKSASHTTVNINGINVPYQTIFDFKYEVIFRMAISFRLLGHHEDSLKLFQSLITTPPNKLKVDDVLFQVGYTYQMMNEFKKAQNIYNDIYQRNADNITVMTQYGWTLISHYMFDNKNNISIFDEGLNLLLDALNKCQTDPLVLFLLGKAMMIKEDYQVAYSYFKKCINYWTDCASFWCDLGILYCKNKQYQDAFVAFQRAVYLSPELSEAWLNMGAVFEKMGQYLNAKKIYLTAKNIIKSQDKENLLSDRIQMLQNFDNNKNHTIDNDLIYLQNDHDFIQSPLEFANNYLAAVPKILSACIGVNDTQTDINLEVLSSYPKSMF